MSGPVRDRVATYRLQFREGMDFERAIEILPYIKRLGASHLYASPLFTATPGSTHGYDVTDYNEIEPAIGGREGFLRLSAALKEHDLGLMLDIVPNHMAASTENPWWRDCCEWGPRARHSGHFDIDWTRRLTLPFLGGPVDEVIEAGELSVARDEAGRGLVLAYYENAWPITPPSYGVLARAAPEDETLLAVAEEAARARPEEAATFHEAVGERLTEDLDGTLERLSRDAQVMARLHDAQAYELTDWRTARHDLSYRRFFEVTGLVGTRVEDPPVFDDIHALTLDLVREGHVDALRVDHIDGLSDPGGYLVRLREVAGENTWILVEKILEGAEGLPDWPIEGTTGYEFIAAMGDLMIPRSGAAKMEAAYDDLTPAPPAAARRDAAKRLIVTQNFEGELTRLTGLAAREASEMEEAALRDALVALIVALPVYRTYGDPGGFNADDAALLARTAAQAGEVAGVAAVAAVVEALSDPGAWEARARFQQLTGPAMAKAVEDTLFYRHTAMLAACEVGCDPTHPPARSGDVHGILMDRGQPEGLITTSTHDTKRGEDARARLYALYQDPETWIAGVERWRAMAEDRGAPDLAPDETWTIYQALAGIWPEDGPPGETGLGGMRERFTDYLVKAMREAKLRTSWTEEDSAYEAAMTGYAEALLDPGNTAFQEDFNATLAPFVEAGTVLGLAQALIKLTSPGVPDIYRGSEASDFSLVDPDNRRPRDFDRLAALLKDATAAWPAGLAPMKIRLTAAGLAERGRRPRLYTHGDYVPVMAEGARARTVFAYLRDGEAGRSLTLVPFAWAPGGPDWADTALPVPDGDWRCGITGAPVASGSRRLAELLDPLPVSLLVEG